MKKCEGFQFYDWELDSNQTSPDTYFPDDLKGIQASKYMIANPGLAPSEATWIEIGYFLRNNTKEPGDFCNTLIIIWREDRLPKWSIDFVNKSGFVVSTVAEAIEKLQHLLSTAKILERERGYNEGKKDWRRLLHEE